MPYFNDSSYKSSELNEKFMDCNKTISNCGDFSDCRKKENYKLGKFSEKDLSIILL